MDMLFSDAADTTRVYDFYYPSVKKGACTIQPKGETLEMASPSLLKPGEVYGYDLDLWQTGIAVEAGHRLRVVVSSTLFPDMDRNLNTGESAATGARMLVAHQKIYHDLNRASYIELPVLRGRGVA